MKRLNQNRLPDAATNIIYTGVAGTGKTHRLLAIQKLYDEELNTTSKKKWHLSVLQNYSWCDVICAALLLEDRLMTVPELIQHPIIMDKAEANGRKHKINQTLWGQLNSHAHPNSNTVKSAHRSADYFFDKTESSQWYILTESKPMLVTQLEELLNLYGNTLVNISADDSLKIQRSIMVSFHQAYGYDEFVEGIRPRINPTTGQMQYEVQNGAFLELCAKASLDPEHRYAMLIDEINRANTAQVFGELMSIIEPSKRATDMKVSQHTLDTSMSVRLAYSGRQFSVPSNVDIYATMNTQDHSLATLDLAFRRRFEFIDCRPDPSLLICIEDASGDQIDLAKMMTAINQRIIDLLGVEAQLGHSYYMNISHIVALAKRLQRQIIPQLIHQVKSVAPASQHYNMLMQILYGTNDIKLINQKGSCLLDQSFIDDDLLVAYKGFTDAKDTSNDPFDTVNLSESFNTTSKTSTLDNDDLTTHIPTHKSLNKSTSNGPQIAHKHSLALNAEFLAVANIESSQTSAQDIYTSNVFLSAMPYQRLYEFI